MTLTVFTTVLGQTDQLRKPTVVNRDVRYVCFADQPFRIRPYECVLVGTQTARSTSRELKILANHPALGDPDITLWHDASFQLLVDPLDLVGSLLDGTDMVAFRHPHRDRIEDEADAIARLGYADPLILLRQVAAYRAAGFIDQRAITSTGFCLRRMTPTIQAFNACWWQEVQTWCWRDQMSVDYALWKTGVRSAYIPGHYRDNPYAKWRKQRRW